MTIYIQTREIGNLHTINGYPSLNKLKYSGRLNEKQKVKGVKLYPTFTHRTIVVIFFLERAVRRVSIFNTKLV